MVTGEMGSATEVLVVGGGPGGYTVATRAAQLGRQVTLVESEAVGGVCLNVGCIPSKALLHVADSVSGAAAAARWGVDLGPPKVDLDRAQEWIGGVVRGLTSGVEGQLARAGVRVMEGRARFAGQHRVAVNSHVDGSVTYVEFDDVVLATGSRPRGIPGFVYDGEAVLDSTDLLRRRSIPERLVVIGGGYIGVELGTAYAKLGSAVTIVELLPSVLPGIEPALARVVQRGLGALGITVRTATRVLGREDHHVVVAPADGEGAEETLACDAVLVAVGRRPNTDNLGLDVLRITPGHDGLLAVGPDRRVNAHHHVFAIGDITPGPALAHKAMAEAEVAALALAGKPVAFDPACIPAVVFCDPEVVTVGMTEAEAVAAGLDPVVRALPLTALGRTATLGRADGQARLVADAEGTVVGVHLVGPGVAELAGEAALAIEMGATVDDVALTIHPHPTLSEAFPDAARLPGARRRGAGTGAVSPPAPGT